MAETLGSLCDKLTIVKLKQWHSSDKVRLKSLAGQEKLLQKEINEFVNLAYIGAIPIGRLAFSANKVFKKKGNEVQHVSGDVGQVFSELAKVNCELWHEQEKVYEFEKVPVKEKDKVVKQLAILNLKRNKCIDSIDKQFQGLVKKSTRKKR